MLSQEENELLTRTGAGTPMGELMRRFWIPFAVSTELPVCDGPPLRVRLLGEDLVMFRGSDGRVGLLDERCPHRQASLYFGRNEQCGLRCVYHGWKFDLDGRCLETPNEPSTSRVRDKVRVRAYPTCERGGLIWAFMGAQEQQPAVPGFEWLHLPDTHRYASRWQQSCNYFQALEGEFDTSHVGFLHSLLGQFAENDFSLAGRFFGHDLAPRWDIEATDYGLMTTNRRTLGDDQVLWRTNHFLLPFYSVIPDEPEGPMFTRCWIPRDDNSSWVICVNYRAESDRPIDPSEIALWKAGVKSHREVIPGTTRPRANRDNEYLIDRERQRTETFSGIAGVRNQDAAMVENQGEIADRTREHLGVSDTALIQLRRRVLEAARQLREGREPVAAQLGDLYRVRADQVVLPLGADYRHGRPPLRDPQHGAPESGRSGTNPGNVDSGRSPDDPMPNPRKS